MTLSEEVEQLARDIKHAMEHGDGYKFGDDSSELEIAVIMEDIQLLKAFLPVVGQYRLANLRSAKEILVKHGYEKDYGKYLTADCIAAHIDTLSLTFGWELKNPRGNHDKSELYALAMTSSEDDRKRIAYLIEERGILDVGILKELLKDMTGTSASLSSGTL